MHGGGSRTKDAAVPLTGLGLLIPIALGLGLLGLVAFFWALRDGQFEDSEGAAARILIDDD